MWVPFLSGNTTNGSCKSFTEDHNGQRQSTSKYNIFLPPNNHHPLHPGDFFKIFKYRIYSCERPRRSFNFGFSKQGGCLFEWGALSTEALIEYIKKTSNTSNLSLSSNNNSSNNNRIIKCLMFKILRKTPLFTKEKVALQAKLAVLQNFLCNSQMSDSFKWYFSNERL